MTTRLIEGGALVKVFLVDDHEGVRRGLVELLRVDPELDFVGEAGSVAAAMAKIKDVSAGRSLLDNRAAAALMAKLRLVTEDGDGFSGLNNRERTLFGPLGEGLTNKQAADRMFLAEAAVKNYVSRLLARLGVARPTQPALSARQLQRLTAR